MRKTLLVEIQITGNGSATDAQEARTLALFIANLKNLNIQQSDVIVHVLGVSELVQPAD